MSLFLLKPVVQVFIFYILLLICFILFYFINNNKECNNEKCGTCIGSADNCDAYCNASCKTCKTNGQCLTCVDSKFVDPGTNLCKNCDPYCKKCEDTTSCTECFYDNRDPSNNC